MSAPVSLCVLWLWLAAVSGQLAGLELKKNPRVKFADMAGQYGKYNELSKTGGKFRGTELRLVKTLDSRSICGFHEFFEDGFDILSIPGVRRDGEEYRVDGLESPVSLSALGSLYYERLFEPLREEFGGADPHTVVVAVRDYYDGKQKGRIRRMVQDFSPGSTVEVVPESFCVASNAVANFAAGARAEIVVLNFRGSRVVKSLFAAEAAEEKPEATEAQTETEAQAEEKTGRPRNCLRSIELRETSVVEHLKSDSEIERAVFGFAKQAVETAVGKPVSLLPYEPVTAEYYAVADDLVGDLLDRLNMDVSVHTHLELFYFNVLTGEKHVTVNIHFDMQRLRDAAACCGAAGPSVDVPADALVYYITAVPNRSVGALLTGHPRLRAVSNNLICDGAVLLKARSIQIRGDEADRLVGYTDQHYSRVAEELRTKQQADAICDNLQAELDVLTHVPADSTESLRRLVEAYRDGRTGTLEESRRLVGEFEAVQAMERKYVSDRVELSTQKRVLQRLIESASKSEPRILERIQAVLTATEEWFGSNGDSEQLSARELEARERELRRELIRARMALKAEEAEKARQAEENKEENKEGDHACDDDACHAGHNGERLSFDDMMNKDNMKNIFGDKGDELYAKFEELMKNMKEKGGEPAQAEEPEPVAPEPAEADSGVGSGPSDTPDEPQIDRSKEAL